MQTRGRPAAWSFNLEHIQQMTTAVEAEIAEKRANCERLSHDIESFQAERDALTAFLEFGKLNHQRQKTRSSVFDTNYLRLGGQLVDDDDTITAQDILEDVDRRIEASKTRLERLQHGLQFAEADLELLRRMAACPAARIERMALNPAHI